MKPVRRQLNPLFALKLWYTTVWVGTLLLFGIIVLREALFEKNPGSWADFLPLMIGTWGAFILLSLPLLACYALALYILVASTLSIPVVKTLSTASCIALLFGICFVVEDEIFSSIAVFVPLLYAGVLSFFTAVFQLQKSPEKLKETP